MDIEKREYVIRLYDLYSNLLTEKQRGYFEDYYFSDLSISEIALNYEISRNGVFDQLKRVCNILEDYENKLKLNEKLKRISELEIDENAKQEVLSILEEE